MLESLTLYVPEEWVVMGVAVHMLATSMWVNPEWSCEMGSALRTSMVLHHHQGSWAVLHHRWGYHKAAMAWSPMHSAEQCERCLLGLWWVHGTSPLV